VKGFVAGFAIGQHQLAYSKAGTHDGARRYVKRQEVLCVPDAVSNGQLIEVFVAYMNAHPESLHEPEAMHFWNALQGSFPCKPKERAK
jgi:hypothetical protein